MNIKPETLRLYAVTDRAWAADEEDFFRQIEAAIRGGAAIVQLREKNLEDAAFLAEAKRFTALCRTSVSSMTGQTLPWLPGPTASTWVRAT